MANIAVAYDAIMRPYPTNFGQMAYNLMAGDFPRQEPTKGITGHVYDVNGAPVEGVTVMLYRQRDGVHVATQQTASNGTYYFERDRDDFLTYFTVAFKVVGGNVQVHGTSDRDLVPA